MERKGLRRGEEEEKIGREECKTTGSEVGGVVCVRKKSEEKAQRRNYDVWRDVSRK